MPITTGRATVAGPANTANSFVAGLRPQGNDGGVSPFVGSSEMTAWMPCSFLQRQSATKGPISNDLKPSRLTYEVPTTVGHLQDQRIVRSDVVVTISAAKLWNHLKQCIAAGTCPLQYLHNIKLLPHLASHIYERWELNHNGSKADSKTPKVMRYMAKEQYADPKEAEYYANLTNGFLTVGSKKSTSEEQGGARYVRPVARQHDYQDRNIHGYRLGSKDRWVVLPPTVGYHNVGKTVQDSVYHLIPGSNPLSGSGAAGERFIETGKAMLAPMHLFKGTDQMSLLRHEAHSSATDHYIRETYYPRFYHEIGCRDSPVFSGFWAHGSLSDSPSYLHKEIFVTNGIYMYDYGAIGSVVFGDITRDFYHIRPSQATGHGDNEYNALWANNYDPASTGVGQNNNMTADEKKLLVQYLQMNRILAVLCTGAYGGKVVYDAPTGKYSFSETDQKLDSTVDKVFTYETRYVFQDPWHRGIADSLAALNLVNNPEYTCFYKRPEEWLQNYNECGGYVTVTIPNAELHTNYYDIPAKHWHANWPLERSQVWQVVNYQFHNAEVTLAINGTGDVATNQQELTSNINPNTLDRVARYLMITVIAGDHYTTGGTHNYEFKTLDLIKSIVFKVNDEKVGTKMEKPRSIEYDYQNRQRYFPHTTNHFPGEHIYIPFGIDNEITNMMGHQVDLATVMQSMKIEIVWDQAKIEKLIHHPDPTMIKQNYTIPSGNVGGNSTITTLLPAKGGIAPSDVVVNGTLGCAGSEYGALEQTNITTVERGGANAAYKLHVHVEVAALVQEVVQMHTGQLQNAQG